MSWLPIVVLVLLVVAALILTLTILAQRRDEREYMRTIGYPKGRVERPATDEEGT